LFDAYGIYAGTRDYGSPLSIVNSGTITTVGPNADGIRAFTGANSPLSIVNSGDISPSGA
jgi:hypothetical protein